MVKISKFRHWTLFYRARNKFKNGIKQIDLTRKRLNLLLDALSFIQGTRNFKYVYPEINCNLKFRFSDNDEKIFSSIGELLESMFPK